jgi:hypothetical protein
MIVNHEHAPVSRNAGRRFSISWPFFSVTVAFNRAIHSIELDGKRSSLVFSGTLDMDISAVSVD